MRSRSVALAVTVALAFSLHAGLARADLNSELDNSIKGLVGCAVLGANLTLIIEGAVGVRNPWLLSLVPIAVAGGGAAGGWFLGQASGEGAVASLVVGMALTVPAAVLVAWALSYRASRDDGEGFVDRTEEGRIGEEDDAAVEVRRDRGTETEVRGPDGAGDSLPPPADADDDDPGDGYGPGAGLSPLRGATGRPFSSLLVASLLEEEWGQAAAPRLRLRRF